jgi:hypothetical protein
MQESISYQSPARQPPTEAAATTRLRTVTGNRFPRKCACGCGLGIPREALRIRLGTLPAQRRSSMSAWKYHAGRAASLVYSHNRAV